MSSVAEHQSCTLCSGTKLTPMPKLAPHPLVKCNKCGLVFMKPIPTTDELDAFYSRYGYSADYYLSPLTVLSYEQLLVEFEPYRKTNRILDVGCGMGFFLEEARKMGWEVYGTEYSPKAIELCENKGITMKPGVLNPEDFGGLSFDVITSFEVLEHINNPQPEMNNIASLLRQGGLFYATTPNYNSLMRYRLGASYNVINYPEHLTYFTKRTLTKLAKDNGLRRVKFLSTGISISRLNNSKKKGSDKLRGPDSSDEKLRQQISGKWYLKVLKRIFNWGMTKTNTGLTLKGYFVKK